MIIVAGESLIDLVHRPHPAAPGSGGGPLYEACPGGSPYNCAIALGRLETEVGFLCPISEDPLGKLLAARLRDSDVALLLEERVTAPTSLAVVTLAPDGSPGYSFYREGTADRQLTPATAAAAIPPTITAFQIGSLALIEKADAAAWSTALETAVSHDAVISIDPNVRSRLISDRAEYRGRLSAMLEQADMIKASDEDLDFLLPGLAPEEAVGRVMERHGIALAVLTRGLGGATAFASSGARVSAPVKSFSKDDPAQGDSIGAGDSFQAGLLAWLNAEGLLSKTGLAALGAGDLESMLDFASTVAGLNCAETGCNPPSLDRVQAARARAG